MSYQFIAVAALVLLTFGRVAFAADGGVECEVLAILATQSNQETDRSLAKFEDIFKKPPFNKFKGFRLVKKLTLEMEQKKNKKLSLPESIAGTLLLDSKIGSQLSFTLTLARIGKKPIRIKGTATPGSPLFAAGMAGQDGGVWIFGVACKGKNPGSPSITNF